MTNYSAQIDNAARNRLWFFVTLAWIGWLIPPIGLFFSVLSLGGGFILLIQGVHSKHALAGMLIGGVVPLTLCALYIVFVFQP